MRTDYHLLKSADSVLSKCGRALPPEDGLTAVDIYAGLFYETFIADQDSQQQPLGIAGPTSFFLSSIAGIPPEDTGVYVQFRFPNGRFHSQALRELTQICGTGSNRYILDPEVECPPGSKILITSDTAIGQPGADQTYSLLLEGVYRFWLKNGVRVPYPQEFAASLPRVFKTRNQNIMVPRWYVDGGEGDAFTYCTPADNPPTFPIPTSGTGKLMQVRLQTDVSREFWARRMFSKITVDDGSSGTVYARVKESSGYQLTDDYVDLAKISGCAFPCWWRIPPGKDIILDLLVVDASGAGEFTAEFWFEGVRRRAG